MKRSGAFASALVAAALAGGCTTITPIDIGGTDPVAGWNAETRDWAGENWLYAQLSINAYGDYESFTLPGDVVQRRFPGGGRTSGNDQTGYAYAVFDRFDRGGALIETIIAYRGTDFTRDGLLTDVVSGSLLGRQHDRGLATATAVHSGLREAGYEDVAITVTGHSLGGGIAHHVTDHPLNQDGVTVTRSIVFNNAPRVAGFDDPDFPRAAMIERGDFVGPFRALGSAPDDLHVSINCQPGLALQRNHSMRNLAECLTWIAAFDEDDARVSLAANPVFGRPATQTEELAPQPTDTIGEGVPVNPYVTEPDLLRAIDARMRESDDVSPYYRQRTGYRLEVSNGGDAGTVAVKWFRNGIEVESQRLSLDCSTISLGECADRIITPGETLITEELAAVRGD